MRVVIAGGGVAGAAAACLLGPDCLLVEREKQPHDKICGEFISAEAEPYLRRLGIDLPALGAVPVTTLRLVYGPRMVTTKLPFPGFGLSRRVLDAALLDRAAASGAEVLRGHRVRSVTDGIADIDGLGRFPHHAVFLATGKHDLRGPRRVAHPTRHASLLGLKMYFELDHAQAQELAGAVEVILFRGGYAGLQSVEGNKANLSLLVEPGRFREAGQDWPSLQAVLEAESAHLARRLRGASALLPRPLACSRSPHGAVHAPITGDPVGLFRLGDQVALIPPFCGDGIAIALHTAFAAAEAHRTGDALAYHRRLRRELTGQVHRATALDRVGRAAPGAFTQIARLWPGALAWAAHLTRIPSWARHPSAPA